MTVLPIVGRELVVAARRAGTYWARFGVAAAALAIFIFLRLSYDRSTATLGHDLFFTLGVLVISLCLLSGVFITADSLSVEKREGTLGLLFLTDLKGYDIVLGKLAANSVHAIFGLLAVFPILGMALLTGGVSGGEFWRTMLVFMAALYFSLSVGMLNSAARHEGRHSIIFTFAVIVVVSTIFPLLWEMQTHSTHRGYWDTILLWPNPAYAFQMGFDVEYLSRFGPGEFWISLAVIFALATACIIAASIILPRSWQNVPSADSEKKSIRLPFFRIFKKRRRRLLGDNAPFYWLAMGNSIGLSALDWTILWLTIPWLACVGIWSTNRSGAFDPITVFYVFGMHLVVKVIMAAECGRRFNQDLQSGAMELLLVTPLPVQDIIAGQRKALQNQFRRSLLLLSLINLITLWLELNWDPVMRQDIEETHIFTLIFVGGALILWLDSMALAWVAMWRGITFKKYSSGILATLGRIMAPPWLAFFLFMAVSFLSSSVAEKHLFFFISLWFVLGVIIDVVSIEKARLKLTTHFRSLVAQRFDG